MSTASDMHTALSASGLEYAGLSTNGFNLFGDRRSIDEAKQWLHAVGVAEALRRELMETRDHLDRLTQHHNEQCPCGAIF
jgi:hypothetical protein